LLDLSQAILAGEVESALRLLNDLAHQGKDLGRLVTDLLGHFRNLLIFQVSRGDLTMIEAVEAEIESLKEQSKMIGPEGLTRIMEVFADTEMRLKDAASRKILVEVALLKAIEARKATSIDAVLKQLQKLRDGGAEDSRAPVAAQPSPAARPKTIRTESALTVPMEVAASEPAPIAEPVGVPSQAAAQNGVELADLWHKLLDGVSRASPFMRSYLVNAHPVSFHKNLFIIGFDPEFEEHIGLVDNPKNHSVLQTKLAELGHAGSQFKFIKSDAPIPRAPPSAPEEPLISAAPKASASVATARALPATPTPVKEKAVPIPFNKDDFKNDPLIQKALEIFKGTIVEVRA